MGFRLPLIHKRAVFQWVHGLFKLWKSTEVPPSDVALVDRTPYGLVLRTTSDDPRNYDPYGRDVSTPYSHAVDATASCTQRSLDPTVRAPSVKKSFWSYLDGFPDGFFARPPSPQTDGRVDIARRRGVVVHAEGGIDASVPTVDNVRRSTSVVVLVARTRPGRTTEFTWEPSNLTRP